MLIEFRGETEDGAGITFGVKCETCPDFSEEDGTIFDPPRTIHEWIYPINFQDAFDQARFHKIGWDGVSGRECRVIIERVDINKIKSILRPSY